MSSDPKETGSPRFATVFFVSCFLLIGYFLFVILRPFFATLLWAGVLTVVFLPLFRRTLVFLRGRRAAAAIITCFLILLVIVLPVFSLGILVTQQANDLYHSLQESSGGKASARLQEIQKDPWVQWALGQASKWLGTERLDLRGSMEQVLRVVSRFLVSQGPALLRGVAELLFSFLLMFISMFFLFRDGPLLMEIVAASNPLPSAYESEIIKKFQDVSYAAFFGSIFTAIVQGLAGAILFWALGIGSPLFWGAVIAFVSLVPIVGAFIVWIPWSTYLILMGHTARGITMLALGGLVVSSIDNVLKPIIIRGRTDMHPLLVFLSVLGGMQAFGFPGVIVGPLVVALFLSFLNFYKHEFRETLERKLGARRKV